jgi:hypothetical protein
MRSWGRRLCWLLVVLMPLQGVSALARQTFEPAHYHRGASPALELVRQLHEGGARAMAHLAALGPSHAGSHGHDAAHDHAEVGYHTHDAGTQTAVWVKGADDAGMSSAGVDTYWLVLPTLPTQAEGVGRGASGRMVGEGPGPWNGEPGERPPRTAKRG